MWRYRLCRQLFESMLWRTCVSWTAMISGYADKGDIDEALALFSGMEAAGEKPDMVTVVSLLSGCGQTGSLELGRWLENYALSNGFGDCVRVSNVLIDMYMKCGCINNAIILFYSMPQKTVVSFTTMISGCALNGEIVEALNIFFRMVKLGLNPNHITFLAILQACNHAGFLEKGLEFFDLMTKEYHIDPGLEHYSCIIDLLGRCGKVKEALKLVKKMPAKPDAGVWGGLLHACKIHHNVEIGRWDGVSRVRGLMKCKGVRKSPGQSHIEVNGKNHRFSVEERFHPECSRIYETLGVLVFTVTIAQNIIAEILNYWKDTQETASILMRPQIIGTFKKFVTPQARKEDRIEFHAHRLMKIFGETPIIMAKVCRKKIFTS
ncbi:hypothetical protein Nepgr_031498 [Nepenthes gracilis]|uniref:Pentatricopeptide repeat-containing protein n=1 Tax=Nepenthes gracilis TaxID=150966 RepID=A0AAD3Y6W7_NEPGR|nr:hypothetical protein Nepgr_031498 [Nepenthes gracilis]